MKIELLQCLVALAMVGQVLSSGCGIHIGREKPNRGGNHGSNNNNQKKYHVPGTLPPGCDAESHMEIELPDGSIKSFEQIPPSADRRALGNNKGNNQRRSWRGRSGFSTFEFRRSSVNEDLIVGSMIDTDNGLVYQFLLDANGEEEVIVTHTSDFPPEEDPDDGVRRHLLLQEDDHQEKETSSSSTNLRGGAGGLGGFALDMMSSSSTSRHDQDSSSMLPFSTTDDDSTQSRRLLDDGSVVDIMVVWTKDTECEVSDLTPGCTLTSTTESNMRDFVDLAIDVTNTAYEVSGVEFQLRLVHAYRDPDYNEPSSFGTSLDDLTDTNDGKLDSVHSKRIEYGADVVALLIDNGSSCGIAWLGPRIDIMFSVTHWGCAIGNLSFGHEIGHNFGCNHDRGTKQECSDNDFNYGWRDPDADFRTILAYNCVSGQCDGNAGGGCTRVGVFSNPNVNYNNKPTGDADNDNARRLNEQRVTVAQFFDSVTTCASDSDCEALEACNIGTCDNGVCTFAPIVCDDGDECNGQEICIEGFCEAGVPLVCNVDGSCSSLSACSRLETTFVDNNGSNGNQFRVEAGPQEVSIAQFEIRPEATGEVFVYTKSGTYRGFEDEPSAWTLIHSEVLTSINPNGQSTPLKAFAIPIVIPPGETQSFYVRAPNRLEYTNGSSENNVFSEDTNLKIYEGRGISGTFGSQFSPRVWNGRIAYSVASQAGPPTASPVQPTVSPVTDQPSESPVTDQPSESPVTDQPSESPVTDQPTRSPVTDQPSESPVTDQPTRSPVTDQPSEAPVQPTRSPVTDQPSEAPVQPTRSPVTDQPSESPGPATKLATTFDANNDSNGNMFSIEALGENLALTQLEIHPIEAGDVYVYVKMGSYVISQDDPNAWGLVHQETLTSVNPFGESTPLLPFSAPIFLEAGKMMSIYVRSSNELRYTNGSTEGEVFAENTYLKFFQGLGVAGIFGSTFSPRIWNGVIHYDIGVEAPPTTSSPTRAPVNGNALSLLTTFDDTTGSNGNMFELLANKDLWLTRLQIHVQSTGGVEVYFKEGTYFNFERSPAEWTSIHTESLSVVNGNGEGTPLSPFSQPLFIPAGTLVSLYVRTSNGLRYSAGTNEGDIYAQTDDLIFYEGVGIRGSFGTIYWPRVWNGILEYTLA